MHSPGGSYLGPPVTSFPNIRPSASPIPPDKHSKDGDIRPILINSDLQECNNNMSVYFKHVIDSLLQANDDSGKRTYHKLSVFALKLLNLNLFVKNYSLCLGKILSLLNALTDVEDTSNKKEVDYIKKFACVCLLLLLKIKNESQEANDPLLSIDTGSLFTVLRKLNIVKILSRMISHHIQSLDEYVTSSSYILLKFACDILFEYLYFWELLSDDEFFSLTTETTLIPVLISHLLSHNNFSNYSNEDDEWDDEANLMAYEELKLLLLVNEQYIMKSYYSDTITNQVFSGLLLQSDSKSDTEIRIASFINLLVYHINREESSIVKILILKFLYLVFTTSYTTKLVYLNDLKILVDIFIRELNNLDYSGEIQQENKVLMVTYLKVLCPLLTFSQISESGYKDEEIIDLMRTLITNSASDSFDATSSPDKLVQTISKLAMKCMSVPWLQSKKNILQVTKSNSESSLSLLADQSSLNSEETPFVRVASVRSSTHADYHKHISSHNINVGNAISVENNGNVFLNTAKGGLAMDCAEPLNLLGLPEEILQTKATRASPFATNLNLMESTNSSSSSLNTESLVKMKAMKKKAPPPPNFARLSLSPQPPPPPPPRRRH